MLSEREKRLLAALERHASAEDPRLARMLACGEPWWRAGSRHMISKPALVLALVFGITGCALHLGSLALLFITWAAVGTVVRIVRARDGGDRPTPGARSPGHRRDGRER